MTTVDRARTEAISTQRKVLLAIAEPADLPQSDGRLHLGLFEMVGEPEDDGSVAGRQLGRWRALPRGLVLVGGEVEGLRNLMDEEYYTFINPQIAAGSPGDPQQFGIRVRTTF